MDPFTQRMLERAKIRRDKLDGKKLDLEPILISGEPYQISSKRKSMKNKCDKENAAVEKKELISNERKSKLQKLANFYSRKETCVSFDNSANALQDHVNNSPDKKQQCKSSRFMELSTKIKEWDKDLESQMDCFTGTSNVLEGQICHMQKPKLTNLNETLWSNTFVEQLCSQGYTPKSKTKLVYDFEKTTKEKKEFSDLSKPSANNYDMIKEELENIKAEAVEKNDRKQNEVFKKTAIFERNLKENDNNNCAKDPAELSLKERKALFEKKEELSTPKTLFGFSKTHISQNKMDKKKNLKEVGAENLTEKERKNRNDNIEIIFDGIVDVKPNESASPKKYNESIESEQKIDIAKSSDSFCTGLIKNSQIIDENKSVKSEEFSLMKSHEIKTLGSPCRKNEKSCEACDAKPDRLYPNLNELVLIDENDSVFQKNETLNESQDSNFCLNLTLSDLLDLNKNNPTTPPNEESLSKFIDCGKSKEIENVSETDICGYFSENESEDGIVFSPSKVMKSSSFEYTKTDGNDTTLMHSVSLYRKQQKNSHFFPEINIEGGKGIYEKDDAEEAVLVQKKIHKLLDEVNKQQTIISQASQALNLCVSTVEFYGSGEQVEGERLLLLSTHKRQACLLEIQRLKVENTLWPQKDDMLVEKGDVILRNISLKLKRDSLRILAAAENLSYFVCLIKSDEQVFSTSAVSAIKENLRDLTLSFPEEIKFENLRSNFKITVEIYNLELSKELLPHDVKYHIINKKEKKLLTPIKAKKSESKLIKPNIQSPAGPNAVRTSLFQMCGYIVFSLKEVTRTQWILNKVPYVSPLEGTISMTIGAQLRIDDEFRGFLTMFDDISGFGAWHRRWCLLSSFFISYWKYPDDEQKKVPIGSIDLRSVVSDNVDSVSRDICARRNTFLLESTRLRLTEDRNSLIMTVQDSDTRIRHLLSADSKEEMTLWCKKINNTLALLRNWKCNVNE